MDPLLIVLIVVVILLVIGGLGYPRPAGGPYWGGVNGVLWLLAVIVLIVVVLKILGAA